ncbi:pancreatic triacylglycerol lipase-like [Haliotis rubra]|uniref:pancreatic triacylglycerol lipase-like n=1 Tax=Haliotis rubra TaxID=36100 RepID=UPI001EE52E6E|nr:pancreatic triacylglycerol lipase-like [Haliotis rubra]
MAMTTLYVLLGIVVLGTEGILFEKASVCYDDLGCFSLDNGFDNSFGELPDSPDDVNATLTLFTRKSKGQGQILDYKNEDTIVNSLLDVKEKTKIVVHGYLSEADAPWVTNTTKYLLLIDNFNVITVDWRSGAHKFYPKSVANTRLVGAIIAKTVEIARDRMGAKMADVHLIGHSLGSHISGYVGSRIEGVGRISGLDPAGPLFEGTDPAVRLDPTDAIYVDNIHTDGLPLYDAGLGTLSAWGHVDFYPNGGGDQPGCPAPVEHGLLDVVELKFKAIPVAVSCNHLRSHDYYVASLADAKCDFTAHPCASYKDFTEGSCSSCGSGTCPQMGYFSDRANRQGKFYLETENTYPFCHSP